MSYFRGKFLWCSKVKTMSQDHDSRALFFAVLAQNILARKGCGSHYDRVYEVLPSGFNKSTTLISFTGVQASRSFEYLR